MEFYENGGGAVARLLWSGPGVAKDVVPSTQLYLPSVLGQAPAVSLLEPISGGIFVANSAINLAADAFDPDGAIARVDFYSGTNKLATVANPPYTWAWTNALPGSFPLSAVATDTGGLSTTSAPVLISVVAGIVTNIVLTDRGSVWKYLDTGGDPGGTWPMFSFNDTGWLAGRAHLGYGNGGEATLVSYGPNPLARHITTYFRQTFTVEDPTVFHAVTLNVLRDDGAVIYLNGSPIYRNNMPPGPVSSLTLASTNATGADATANYYSFSVDPGYLIYGANVIAAEVHLSDPAASTLGFDLQLTGTRNFIAPSIITQPQSQTVIAGSTVTLSVAAAGTSPLAYQWRRNGVDLAGANGSALSFPYALPELAGNYAVLVSNPGGVGLQFTRQPHHHRPRYRRRWHARLLGNCARPQPAGRRCQSRPRPGRDEQSGGIPQQALIPRIR